MSFDGPRSEVPCHTASWQNYAKLCDVIYGPPLRRVGGCGVTNDGTQGVPLNAKLPLRISAVILFLFALGHTVGFLTFRPTSPEALAVMESMRSVPFAFGNTTVHWMDLYEGFGLAISVSGFFSAILAWRLSNATAVETALARTIAWLLCATQVASIVLSLKYFSMVQVGFSIASAAALAWSALRLKARDNP